MQREITQKEASDVIIIIPYALHIKRFNAIISQYEMTDYIPPKK